MNHSDLLSSLLRGGHDASRLIFEDELTGIQNRRFLHQYLKQKVAWDFADGWTISALMIDIDHFKEINDTYGHAAGDQALSTLAMILREESGASGIPIRYGGDEFLVLMPGVRKDAALEAAQRLLRRAHGTPVNVEGSPHRLTLSIGVASAPDDARDGKGLLQRADLALYHAKRSGRDQISDTATLSSDRISARVALQQLGGAALMAGRSVELASIIQAVGRVTRGGREFLVIEAAAGMGKSTLLETLRTRLSVSSARVVFVKGVPQEAYRPYYLASLLVAGLFAQRPDFGGTCLQAMSAEACQALGHLLPRVVGPPEGAGEGPVDRERIFNALVDILAHCAQDTTLAILVDDLQYADEATLMVLRRVVRQHGLRVLVCGATAAPIAPCNGDRTPLDQFREHCGAELNMQTVVLNPLTDVEITGYLHALFQGIHLPSGFAAHLTRITQGNPLFLSELLRKLIADGKIAFREGRWCLHPLDDRYLPTSLEEVVKEKLAALEDENRQLLAHACTVGEDVSVSFLAGSAQTMEVRVLEFIDRAAELGLVRTDFQLTDETIQFLGKRILEIVDGGIDPAERRQLHERIGTYQEQLYRDGLLPSASYLAYHFKRSANREKARRYEQTQAEQNARVFNAQEAAAYRDTDADPSESDRLVRVSAFVRSLQTAVGTARLYPADHSRVRSANCRLAEAIRGLRGSRDRLDVAHAEQSLLVDGQPVDISEYEFDALMCLRLLDQMKLRRIIFEAPLSDEELQAVVDALAHVQPADIDEAFWPRFCEARRFRHVQLLPGTDSVRGRAMPVMRDADVAGVSDVVAEAAPLPLSQESRAETLSTEPLAVFLETAVERIRDGLTAQDHRTDHLLDRFGRALRAPDDGVRHRAVEVARELFKAIPVGFHQSIVRRLSEPLAKAAVEEHDGRILAALASLAHRMGAVAIQFGDHALATRLFSALSERRRYAEGRQDPATRALARTVDLRPDPSIEKLLIEDLLSGDSRRHEASIQVLGSLGPSMAPVLVDVIKHAAELRPRQLAARLLADLGSRAVAAFKRELVADAPPEQRLRLLDVADVVTPMLTSEVARALGEGDPSIREAAIRLARRLEDKAVGAMLIEQIGTGGGDAAVTAMKLIGEWKPAGATDALLTVLRSDAAPTALIAACEALGRLADPAGVDALAEIATPKGMLFFRKRRPIPVRVAAALALKQINDPRVAPVLAALARDVDPRLRSLTKSPS